MEGQASKATPPLPTFLGRGFLLMEDGALHEALVVASYGLWGEP